MQQQAFSILREMQGYTRAGLILSDNDLMLCRVGEELDGLEKDLEKTVVELPDYSAEQLAYALMKALNRIKRMKWLRQQRGYLSSKRKKQLVEAAGHCQFPSCGNKMDLTNHHILPVRYFGTNVDENLRVLCKSCHGKYESSRYIKNKLIPRSKVKDKHLAKQRRVARISNLTDKVIIQKK